MPRRLRVPIAMALGLLVALAAAAVFSSAEVSFRSAERDGARVAEVLMCERPVIVLRTSAGAYHPLERAEIVANRLRAALTEEVQSADVEVGWVEGGAGLYIRDQLIVAVYGPEAEAHEATTEALARLWRDNVLLALGYGPAEEKPPSEPPTGEGAASEKPGEPSEASEEAHAL